MKKNLFMVAAVALMALVSCNKEVAPSVENVPVGEIVTFTAYADCVDATKAQLNNDQQSEWVSGDKITIHNGTKGYTFATTEAGAKVDFSYTGNDFSGDKFMAVYPAGNYTVDVEAKTVKANIPTFQQAQAGTYLSEAALAVAYSENTSLSFKNATTLLKFTVNADNVTHVIFHGNNGEGITGDVSVALTNEGTNVTVLPTEIIKDDKKVADLGTWIEFYAWHDENHKYFEKGTSYYIAVAPQVFEKGVTVKVKVDEGEEIVVKTTDKKVTLSPSKIMNLGVLEFEEPTIYEWSIAGSLNGWNTSATPFELDGDYYVAKNVNFEEAGEFKLVNNGTTWYNADGSFETNKWVGIVANDGANISIAAGTYDFYLSGSNLQVVTAGSDKPLAPGIIPVEDGYVYLKPSSNWSQANARFAIYFFGNGETWVSMTKIEGTPYYGAKISDTISKGYTGMIFCRMNPSATANNWNNKWNQSGDLKVSDFTSGNNSFDVPSGSWDSFTDGWKTITQLN